MSTKRDCRKVRSSQFLLDYLKSIGPDRSLQRGREDELFGHYWTNFVKQLQNDSTENTGKGGTSSESCFFKTSSEDPEDISRRIDKEFVETNVSLPSEFEKEREVLGILDDRAQLDSRSGICFTETQEMTENLESQMELPSTSKQQPKVKPASDKHRIDSENLSTGSLDTEASVREAEVTTVDELTREQVTKALSEGIKLLEDRHCGHCDTRFGNAKSVLGKVMYMCRQVEITRNQTFKCLSCSKVLNSAKGAKYHFVGHVRKNTLYCMECQMKMNDGKVIYDLETFDIPITAFLEETTQKLPKLYSKSVANLLKLSPSCATCSTYFENISENLFRLFEIHHSQTCKLVPKTYVFCCIICSKCYTQLLDMVTHLLDHFHENDVVCKKCYDDVSSPKNLHFISSTQTVDNTKAKRLVNFNKSLKIYCGKCTHYLSESAVLEPSPVKMFQKSIEGDVLKIRTQKLHKCVLCLNAFNDIEIVKHITDHINSNHIACKKCQNTYNYGVASISRTAFRLGKNKNIILCTNCNNPFCYKDLQSHFSAFSIMRTENEQSTGEIFVCEFCKTAVSTKSGIMAHIIAHISNKQIFCNSCATKVNIDERLFQQHD